jgi:histidine triad (HIT) family protein
MASIFTKIIENKIPCYKIAENEDFIAFLDIMPLQKGHSLVVPKKEVDYIFDNDDKTLADILPFSKRVAKAIQEVTGCKRIGICVMGLEVPHTHLHLIPMDKESDMNFSNPKLKLSSEEFEEIAVKISSLVEF